MSVCDACFGFDGRVGLVYVYDSGPAAARRVPFLIKRNPVMLSSAAAATDDAYSSPVASGGLFKVLKFQFAPFLKVLKTTLHNV